MLSIDGGHFEALNRKATNLLLMGSLHESVAQIYKVRIYVGQGLSCFALEWSYVCPGDG